MKILIAEDDENARKTLLRSLRRQGHEVVEVANGEQAWQKIQEQEAPRLLILDIMMPKMDGLILCKKIKSHYTWNPPYIILLSGLTDEENVIHGLEEIGADDYVTKPCNFKELQARIKVGQQTLKTQDSLLNEIERHKTTQNQLHNTSHKLSKLVETIADGIVVLDKNGTILFTNPEARHMLGRTEDELLGNHFGYPLSTHENSEIELLNTDGKSRVAELRTQEMEWDGAPALLACFRDITDRKLAEQQLEYMSFRDSLTGLYNRNFFQEEMERLADGRNNPVGIIVCDVDGLKFINDTLGHKFGDEQIINTAEILKNNFRASDIIARIGGDEFAVLVPQTDRDKVEMLSQRLRESVAEYNNNDPKIPLSLSVGSAVNEQNPTDMQTMFSEADNRMYKEKSQQEHSSPNDVI